MVLLTAAGVALQLSMSAPPTVAFATAFCRRFPGEPPGSVPPAVAMAATTQLLASKVVTLIGAVVVAVAVKVLNTVPRLTTPEYDATAATISVPVQQTFTFTKVLFFVPSTPVDHRRTRAQM